ncbi:hypothetical protein, partial [Enterobacter sp.]|uniref:hypothetical protein n=1 Tax=Enterobacter sp. TaxID=42895 RepID=UPI0031DD0D54
DKRLFGGVFFALKLPVLVVILLIFPLKILGDLPILFAPLCGYWPHGLGFWTLLLHEKRKTHVFKESCGDWLSGGSADAHRMRCRNHGGEKA